MKLLTTTLQDIIEQVVQNPAVQDKMAIYRTHACIGNLVEYQDPFFPSIKHSIQVGDDCAALPDGQGGHLLFASEGIIPSFINHHPWFAGYSAVMVNISDICSMGGLPMAVTDVLWLQEQKDGEEIWKGMKAASEAYNVPIVGGHTCYRSGEKHLAVSIMGKATNLLTSYDAQPDEVLLMAVDLNGSYFENYPFWNASTTSLPLRLQKNMRLMYQVAELGLSKSAKDISMGGIIGTLAMLMNTSNVGAHVQLEQIPKPAEVSWEKWLVSFPSFGYLVTAPKENAQKIKCLFEQHAIACEAIGEITIQRELKISGMGECTIIA